MITFIGPAVDIVLIGAVLVVISRIISMKMGRKGGFREQMAKQKEMMAKQKRIKELMGKNDEKSRNELAKLQQEIMQETMAGMKQLFITMPIFLLAFGGMWTNYGETLITLPFNVPFLGTESGWYWWYLITYFSMTIIVGIAFRLGKMVKKDADKK